LVRADCGVLLGLCEQKNILACLAPLKNLCRSAGHYAARSLYGSMAGLVGMAPYQPDGRQTENILLISGVCHGVAQSIKNRPGRCEKQATMQDCAAQSCSLPPFASLDQLRTLSLVLHIPAKTQAVVSLWPYLSLTTALGDYLHPAVGNYCGFEL
jgi:hypothetical protein